MFEDDRRNRYAESEAQPAMIPVVAENPRPRRPPCRRPIPGRGSPGDRQDPGTLMAQRGDALRSVEMFTRNTSPGAYVGSISATPMLLVVAQGDHLTVADEALAAYERALEPKKLEILAGGHFDAYVKDFQAAAVPARDWFVAHLK